MINLADRRATVESCGELLLTIELKNWPSGGQTDANLCKTPRAVCLLEKTLRYARTPCEEISRNNVCEVNEISLVGAEYANLRAPKHFLMEMTLSACFMG